MTSPRHNEIWIVATKQGILATAKYDNSKGWWRYGADRWYPFDAFEPRRRYTPGADGAAA